MAGQLYCVRVPAGLGGEGMISICAFMCISMQSCTVSKHAACVLCVCKFSLRITCFHQICSPSSQMGLLDYVGKTITAEDERTYCGGPGKGELAICNGGTKMI